jgi:Putative antitoxin of bacterial toxin-antitoxin system, YdaS/YdaT
MTKTALRAAIEAAHKRLAGTAFGAYSWIARELGVSRETVRQWVDRGSVPEAYIPAVQKLTGMGADTMQQDITERVDALSRKLKKSPRDTEIHLMRIGLAHLNGPAEAPAIPRQQGSLCKGH